MRFATPSSKILPDLIQTGSARLVTVILTLLVFVAALVSRIGMLDLPPIYDELYHILSAMSWQQARTFAVLDGVYERSAAFTRLVALSFDLAGERSAAAARFLPSVVPGALLVAVMFLWTRVVAGQIAAWIVAAFLLFWPNGIEVSQYIRFYSLHGLTFVVGALVVYAVMTAHIGLWMRLTLIGGAAILLLFALHLQLTTLISVAALGLWVAVIYGPRWLARHPWGWWAIGAGLILVIGFLASGVPTETLEFLWTTYRWEPWPVLRDTTFYHRDFRDNYPTFWPLFAFAALIALRARFVPASFCLTLFAVTFVLHSFGGLKNIRYLYPTMPFFFAIWAIALQASATGLGRYFRDTAEAAVTPIALPAMRKATAATMLVVSGLFLVAANAAFERSVGMIAGSETEYLLGKRRWQWDGVREMAEPWLRDGAIVITTEEMRAVEWLGDFDIAFNRPRFSELLYSYGPDTPPFSLDFRTGRPLAGRPENLQAVIDCAPVGLVLSDAGWINSDDARTLARMAQKTGADIVFEARDGVSMLAWRRNEVAALPEACPSLPGLDGGGAARRLVTGESRPRNISSTRTAR